MGGAKVRDVCAPYIDKIYAFFGMGKKKKKEPTGPVSSSFKPGEVVHLQSEEHLNLLMSKSKEEGFSIVLDFSAPWCKPCQRLKPKFETLAAQYTKDCFVEINCDDHDDVQSRCGVMALPTFQVYAKGEEVGSTSGDGEEKLVALMKKHLGDAPEEGKKGQ